MYNCQAVSFDQHIYTRKYAHIAKQQYTLLNSMTQRLISLDCSIRNIKKELNGTFALCRESSHNNALFL